MMLPSNQLIICQEALPQMTDNIVLSSLSRASAKEVRLFQTRILKLSCLELKLAPLASTQRDMPPRNQLCLSVREEMDQFPATSNERLCVEEHTRMGVLSRHGDWAFVVKSTPQ